MSKVPTNSTCNELEHNKQLGFNFSQIPSEDYQL